jgi:hypothetical protein
MLLTFTPWLYHAGRTMLFVAYATRKSLHSCCWLLTFFYLNSFLFIDFFYFICRIFSTTWEFSIEEEVKKKLSTYVRQFVVRIHHIIVINLHVTMQ